MHVLGLGKLSWSLKVLTVSNVIMHCVNMMFWLSAQHVLSTVFRAVVVTRIRISVSCCYIVEVIWIVVDYHVSVLMFRGEINSRNRARY